MSEETELLTEIKHILRLVYRKEVTDALREVREDAVMAAIIETVGDGSTETPGVQRDVAKKCNVSERTVRDRIAALVELGILDLDRTGRSFTCRVTSLGR